MEKDLANALGRRVSILKRGDLNYINIQFVNQKELEKFSKYLLKFLTLPGGINFSKPCFNSAFCLICFNKFKPISVWLFIFLSHYFN